MSERTQERVRGEDMLEWEVFWKTFKEKIKKIALFSLWWLFGGWDK